MMWNGCDQVGTPRSRSDLEESVIAAESAHEYDVDAGLHRNPTESKPAFCLETPKCKPTMAKDCRIVGVTPYRFTVWR